MSALLEMCPKDVKEQMMMKLDEIAVNYENFKAKVLHTRPARPGKHEEDRKRCMYRWRVDHVSGNETPKG